MPPCNHADFARWTLINDLGWDIVLGLLAWKDIAHARCTCRSWRRDVDRCLQRLHLRDPTPENLTRLGAVFSHLSTVKITATAGPHEHDREHDHYGHEIDAAARLDSAELKGGFGRVASLRLRSKRPGGLPLRVGSLRLLRTPGAALSRLSLRSCEVTSWAGLEACPRLAQLEVVHCRLSAEAALGLTSALASLPRLTVLELVCCPGAGPASRRRRPHGPAAAGQDGPMLGHQPQPQPQQHVTPQQQRQRDGRQLGAVLTVPVLEGLGAAAPGLTALRLAAPLCAVRLRGLLRSMGQLRELDFEIQLSSSSPLDLAAAPHAAHAAVADNAAAAAGAAGAAAAGGAAIGMAAAGYRELAAVLPAVCAAAPELTSLRIKGHTRVTDRDLELLAPLRHLRRLTLDLPPADAVAVAVAAHPPPHQHPHPHPQHPHPHPHLLPPPDGAPAGGGGGGGSGGALSAGGVRALLRGAPRLAELSLGNAAWSVEGLRALGAGAAELCVLRLAGVELPKDHTLCGFLHGLRCLPHLLELDLSGCARLSDWGLALLGRRAAAAGGGGPGGGSPGGPGGGGRLAALSLRGCGEHVSDVGVAALAPLMASLRRLDLGFTERLTDAGLAGLLRGGAPRLHTLSISGCCRVTGAGVQAIVASCPALRELDLDHCTGLAGHAAAAAAAAALRGAASLRRVSLEGCPAELAAALAGCAAARPRRCHAAVRWWLSYSG